MEAALTTTPERGIMAIDKIGGKTAEQKAAHTAYMRKWLAKNPEKRKAASVKRMERAKAVLESDPIGERKRRAERTARYRARHPDQIKQNLRKWRSENPDAFRRYARNRRALKRNSEGTHTQDDIDRIFKQQKFRCAYCRTSIRKEYHVDHIVPLSKDGSNWPSNLQLTCEPCNLKKRNFDAMDFARKNGFLL